MTDERIIMIDDPEAAQPHVMDGWLALYCIRFPGGSGVLMPMRGKGVRPND